MSSKERARALRKQSTWAEKLMWRWLKNRRFSSYKFRRQHPSGPYFLDFYCQAPKLAIELDGMEHGFPEQQSRDAARDAYFAERGIYTYRIWNSRLRREPEVVRENVWRLLQERLPQEPPEYTRPMCEADHVQRPHPNPLPQEREARERELPKKATEGKDTNEKESRADGAGGN